MSNQGNRDQEGNLGQPDTRARYDLPPDQIERYVAGFITEVSSA